MILRLAAGIALFAHGLPGLRTAPTGGPFLPAVLAISGGTLRLAGLWTPITGTLVAVLGLWFDVSRSGDPWADILLATIGAALALLGPGALSVDAKLFGRKRIHVPTQES
jgi:uncharacterized membrane protein YphA (DoxX/SURF4 family)